MTEPNEPPPSPPRPRAVFARHAASLLVVREGPDGPEVLMGIRGKGHRFMPDHLVFPGGAVDPEDAAAAAGSEPRPDVMALLTRRAQPRLARAIALCAARELREETGVSLGTPPRLDQLEYLCRAITPPVSPIRFNARFLVVAARSVLGEPADSHELHGVGYRAIADIKGEQLALVTREVLGRFLEWRRQAPGSKPGDAGTSRPQFEKLVYRHQKWAVD